MVDTKKYEGALHSVTEFLKNNEQYGDDWSEERKVLNDLLAEVRRLRSYIAHHDGNEYRYCPECQSIDFTFKFDDESMECKCDKCDNIWTVKLE